MPNIPNSFNQQCPNRGPSLSHVRDIKTRPDGGCVFCGFGGAWKVCKGYMCVSNTYGDYCEKCTMKRAQHAYNHKIEGHSNPIQTCPPCEEGMS